jgi:hypothetical protein
MKHKNGKVVFDYFAPARIALAKEVQYHPLLIDRLQKHPQAEFEVLLAEIATYCEVIMDGDYYPEDFDRLCGILETKLRAKRAGLLLPAINHVGN